LAFLLSGRVCLSLASTFAGSSEVEESSTGFP
jgi:hypothetical protein